MSQLDPDCLDALLADVERRHGGDAIGPATSIELIDWATIHDRADEIVEGLLIPGRWTALAAGAKAGKSSLAMFVTVEISLGRDPFGRTPPGDPVGVLYVDGEMGRFDLEERLAELGHRHPETLTHWHATDMPPKLDTLEGGNALQVAAKQLGVAVVVIDGINGTVTGAEKDDTTWRSFFDFTIAPLKRHGIAVLTGDNIGKVESLGPRGSSVKIDKPDAVVRLTRTDNGVKLTTTHRRTSAYPAEQNLRIAGLDGRGDLKYWHVDDSWPDGTERLAKILDELNVDTNATRRAAREALAAAGETARNDALGAALRWRKSTVAQLAMKPLGGPF